MDSLKYIIETPIVTSGVTRKFSGALRQNIKVEPLMSGTRGRGAPNTRGPLEYVYPIVTPLLVTALE